MTIDNRQDVRNVLVTVLFLNVTVMLIKAGLGWWTGSLSLFADALHSITDSANNVLGLTMNRLASPEPDREHPYGHQKFDAIGALGIAAFLGIACFEILEGAVGNLFSQQSDVAMSPQVLELLLVVLGLNIIVAVYERSVGERVNSSILLSDAQHTMSDIWVTGMVMLGLVGVGLGYQWVDVVLAFPVCVLVFASGWSVLQHNLPWLVDEMAIAPEAIHDAVINVPGVLNCHDIASRGLLGRQTFIEMHLVVDSDSVEVAHDITEEVEAILEQKYAPIRATIHIEPRSYSSEQISFGEVPATEQGV
ncbi:cation transporter [Acaryochloris sp. 'Moss Beach']|uniref:cation diffusion facilitator family transporter n=1 Tax=Acaryochloris TaxID=155977 RepID=UPI001BAF56C9|nr:MULTISPECIES: cation diffusion facilitator family transporter [Acaryochloris]QUY41433.1 cation transporter [Acaryochloris marina S15]UJB70604.1 cation transporter [Acaryochloris sp. 'Moss Beach']